MPFLATIQHVYCDTLLPSSHCPNCCVMIQFLFYQDTVPQPTSLPIAIQFVSCNTIPSQAYLLLPYYKLYCNTVSPTARLLKSQYNCCIAIQIHSLLSCFLQYKSLSHNIIWAIDQKRFCRKYFFFIINFFFHLFLAA